MDVPARINESLGRIDSLPLFPTLMISIIWKFENACRLGFLIFSFQQQVAKSHKNDEQKGASSILQLKNAILKKVQRKG